MAFVRVLCGADRSEVAARRQSALAERARLRWVRYLRYQAASPNGRGTHPGIFALSNGLARDGTLSSADHAWWGAANTWYDAAYPDPGASDPGLFDRSHHPVVVCWFKASATDLLAKVPGYLALLERYGVAWQRVDSDDPGRVLYEDARQVVVAPHGGPCVLRDQSGAGAMDEQEVVGARLHRATAMTS